MYHYSKNLENNKPAWAREVHSDPAENSSAQNCHNINSHALFLRLRSAVNWTDRALPKSALQSLTPTSSPVQNQSANQELHRLHLCRDLWNHRVGKERCATCHFIPVVYQPNLSCHIQLECSVNKYLLKNNKINVKNNNNKILLK